MSPENANIFLAEDNAPFVRALTIFLKINGHTVVETARTLNEALEKISGLTAKGVNVAIVDGNLTKDDTSGIDGEIVAKQIKAQHPRIFVIGYSSENIISAADVNCDKSSLSELVEDISKA